MYFESFGDFIQMGRHGVYVWSAYGIALFVLLLNVFLPLRQQQRVLASQARQWRREASGKAAQGESGSETGMGQSAAAQQNKLDKRNDASDS